MSRGHDAQAAVVPPRPAPSVPAATPAPAIEHRWTARDAIKDYIAIARPDHWCKNVFMVLGVLLAYFYHPVPFGWETVAQLVWAVAATCLVASSNYVLNEILDARTDREHPVKR